MQITRESLGIVVQDPTIYRFKVFTEATKEWWRREKLGPPSLDQWPEARSVFNQLYADIMSGAFRNYTGKDVFNGAKLGAEVVGFFLVGEMIGRRSLIGYKTE